MTNKRKDGIVKLALPSHKTTPQNRTNYVHIYSFVFTGNDPRKGWRIPLKTIKYNEQRDALALIRKVGDFAGLGSQVHRTCSRATATSLIKLGRHTMAPATWITS